MFKRTYFTNKPFKTRLQISFFSINIILLLTGMIAFYYHAQDNIKLQLRHQLIDIAEMSVLMLDVDKHKKIQQTMDSNSKDFKELNALLERVNSNNDSIRSIYTVIRTDKPNNYKFILNAERYPKDLSQLGDIFDASDYPAMQQGFTKSSAAEEIVSDEWGYTLSGYAPIKDSSGQTIAMLGVDISASVVINEELHLLISGLIILLCGNFLSWYLSKKVVNVLYEPLQSLLVGIKNITNNNFNYKLEVNSKDELGELALAFNNMASQLRGYQLEKIAEVNAEKERRSNIFKVYKDVMNAVTKGKLLLLNKDELNEFLQGQTFQVVQEIIEKEDVGLCRGLSEKFLCQFDLNQKDLKRIILAVSEGTTNVLKHANQGEFYLTYSKGSLKIIIKDSGAGMPFDKIPHMVLFGGFSTKISLGFGFSIMYQNTDRLILSTSRNGTTLIMEKFINVQENQKIWGSTLEIS